MTFQHTKYVYIYLEFIYLFIIRAYCLYIYMCVSSFVYFSTNNIKNRWDRGGGGGKKKIFLKILRNSELKLSENC